MPPSKGRRGARRKSTMPGVNLHARKGSYTSRPTGGPRKQVRRSARAKPARSSVKLQRWMDLLAALLARHYPVTLEELTADVPGYAHTGTGATAWRRMFEMANPSRID